MNYTTDEKLSLHHHKNRENHEFDLMYTPDTTLQSHLTSISKPQSIGRIGTIKLLILAIVFPIMILTIVNPMWVCIFMKTPHLHEPITTTNGNVKVHDHTNPKANPHTNTQFKGGIKITKETLDIIVASKDGRHLQELETSVTIIENVTPNTNKQPLQHNHESIMNRIREGVFKNRNSCAYFALTILLLSAIIIGGVIFYFRDVSKMYNDENQHLPNDEYYVRIDDCEEDDDDNKTTVEESSTYDEKNVTEDNTTTEQDHNLTQVSFNDAHFGPTSTLEPPLYSSNTNHELISAASLNPLTVNIQQSVDENKL